MTVTVKYIQIISTKFPQIIKKAMGYCFSLSTYQKRSLVRSGTSEATREFSIGVLASWDFGIFERKSVKIKRSMIRQGLLVFYFYHLL